MFATQDYLKEIGKAVQDQLYLNLSNYVGIIEDLAKSRDDDEFDQEASNLSESIDLALDDYNLEEKIEEILSKAEIHNGCEIDMLANFSIGYENKIINIILKIVAASKVREDYNNRFTYVSAWNLENIFIVETDLKTDSIKSIIVNNLDIEFESTCLEINCEDEKEDM